MVVNFVCLRFNTAFNIIAVDNLEFLLNFQPVCTNDRQLPHLKHVADKNRDKEALGSN